jgi:nitrogen fixation protein FixH
MGTVFKFLGILFVLSLLALPVTGCDNPPWEAGMTLSLKIDAPKNGTTVNTSTVTVSGRVNGTQSANAKVRINDADVPVEGGKYSANVTLTEGKNVISIVAAAGQAQPKEDVIVTYVPIKQ